MRSLFLRIFLSFWAAVVLILAGGLSVTMSVASYRLGQLQNIDWKKQALVAEARLRERGLEGLKQWVRETEEQNRGGIEVYVIDETGDDFQGKQLTPRWRRYVDALERTGLIGPWAAQTPRPVLDPELMPTQFKGPDGTIYTIISRYTGWPPVNVLRTPDVSIVLLLIALSVSGLVCWWLARYLSQPIMRLQASARSLAAGNLEDRVGEDLSRRHDELGVLAADFNRMADHLRMLIDSKERLVRALSHELRSPLARLRVALGLARRDGADIKRQLDRIELEAERLDTMIGQMLHLSQLRAAAPTLVLDDVDLTALVHDVVEDARLEASAQGKQVVWTPTTAIHVDGVYDLLRSGIENVLRNAIRFTAPSTAVEVEMSVSEDWVSLSVRDHGPGVPEPELERIFDAFYRVEQARDRDSGGTGLGLAITAQVVGLHSGRVQAQNASGAGLNVIIRIPAKRSRIGDKDTVRASKSTASDAGLGGLSTELPSRS